MSCSPRLAARQAVAMKPTQRLPSQTPALATALSGARTPCWLPCALLLTACADVDPTPLEPRQQAVVYGADDRRDLYQLPRDDAGLRSLARSVAAVIPRDAIDQGDGGAPILLGETLAETFGLCADQPYAQEVSAAVCTAFLIDDALLATAGHCFNFALDCKNYLFVFDYVRDARTSAVRLAAENIFECTRTRVRVDEMEPGVWKRDYAIVELSRRAVGRTPLAVRSQPIALGEPVSVISASAGLPLKVDRGAHVLDARAHMNDFFRLDSDTAHGSSGAPVFDADGLAVGIVVRGRSDYLLNEPAGCYVENVLPMPDYVPPGERVKLPGGNELYSEEANPIAPALSALCALTYPSPRLCGNDAVCGDRICSGTETFATCASDCSEAPAPSPAPPPVMEDDEDAGTQLLPVAESSAAGAEHDAAAAPVAIAVALPHAHASAHAGCSLGTANGAGVAQVWLLALGCALRSPRRRFNARRTPPARATPRGAD
jgi:hypothetical protein